MQGISKVYIALNEMLQYESDAKKVHEDNLDAEEIGNLVGDDATESMSDEDILDDESENINDDDTISLNEVDDDLGVIEQDEEDLFYVYRGNPRHCFQTMSLLTSDPLG